jgi:hypothetical protein
MRHDKLQGLIHLTYQEQELLDEPRSPIDERVAMHLLTKAQRMANAVMQGLVQEYTHPPSVVARNISVINALRAEHERRSILELELADVAYEVELKYCEDIN